MKHRTNIYLTQEQVQRLRELRTKTGATVAELIRRAIDGYLKKEERAPARKA